MLRLQPIKDFPIDVAQRRETLRQHFGSDPHDPALPFESWAWRAQKGDPLLGLGIFFRLDTQSIFLDITKQSDVPDALHAWFDVEPSQRSENRAEKTNTSSDLKVQALDHRRPEIARSETRASGHSISVLRSSQSGRHFVLDEEDELKDRPVRRSVAKQKAQENSAWLTLKRPELPKLKIGQKIRVQLLNLLSDGSISLGWSARSDAGSLGFYQFPSPTSVEALFNKTQSKKLFTPGVGNGVTLYVQKVFPADENKYHFVVGEFPPEKRFEQRLVQTQTTAGKQLARFMDGVVPQVFLRGLTMAASLALIFDFTGHQAFAEEFKIPDAGVLTAKYEKGLTLPAAKMVKAKTSLILDADFVREILKGDDGRALFEILKDTQGQLIFLDTENNLWSGLYKKITDLKSGLTAEEKINAVNLLGKTVLVNMLSDLMTLASKPNVAVLLTQTSTYKIPGKLVVTLNEAVNAKDWKTLIALTRILRQAAALKEGAVKGYLTRELGKLTSDGHGGWLIDSNKAIEVMIQNGNLVAVSA